MLAREVRILAIDGFSPPLAEIAAKRKIASQLRDVDAETTAELGRHHKGLHRKLTRLLEDTNGDLS